MNKTQTNQLNMGVAVLAGLDESNLLWAGSAKAQAKRDELSASIENIKAADKRQFESGSGGERVGKIEAKRNLADVADIVGNGVCGYATEVREHTAFMEFDRSKTAVFAMKDVDCLAYCRKLSEYAGLHDAALADYNVSAAVLGQLDDAIESFNGVRASPTLAKASYGTAGSRAKEGLKAMFATLQWWDKFMGTLRRTEHDFYVSYRVWRKVLKTGVRRVSIRGKVVTDEPGTPIYRVKVRVEGDSGVSYTGKAGKFRVFSLKPGVYTLRFELKGCEVVSVANVSVVHGKITEVEVRMKKED